MTSKEAVDSHFTVFPKFPLELRLEIWRFVNIFSYIAVREEPRLI